MTHDLPDNLPPSGAMARLVETARGYADAAQAKHTRAAYRADWQHFTRWCARRGVNAYAMDGQVIALYLADCAQDGAGQLSVATLERRLSGLAWHYQQRGQHLDRRERHIASVLKGIRRKHAKPPVQKAALSATDIITMTSTLSHDLRGLRDRAILLIGYAGALRRSEIVGLDLGRDQSADGKGWITQFDEGLILNFVGKTGWREVEIGCGSSAQSCPVEALARWLHFARREAGPAFVRTTRDGKKAQEARLSDRHVARLIKGTAEAAKLRPELYSGHSLRAGLATHAAVDERFVQGHLGHSSTEMTRRYMRKGTRFAVNMTKAGGL